MHWVALFRGVNVGGHRKMPMAELRDLVGRLGFQDAKTYIQSGNLTFRSGHSHDDLSKMLSNADPRGIWV